MARSDQLEIAVIGLGRFGSSVALGLMERGYRVLGIDISKTVVQHLSNDLTQTVALDATDEDALQAVDLASFETVVVAIGTNFEMNVLTTVACKNIGVKRVICKALTERQRTILLKIGADRVVLPEVDAGMRLASELATPSVSDIIPVSPDWSVALIQVPTAIAWQSLRDADLTRRFGLTVLAHCHDGALTISPPGDRRIGEHDSLVVIGAPRAIARLAELD